MRFSRKLFLIFVFILPFQFALSSSSGIDLAMGRVFLAGLFLIWLLEGLICKKIFIPRGAVSWGLLVFLLWSGFSLFWAENQGWAGRKFLFFLSFFPVYFIAADLFAKEGGRLKNKTITTFVFSGFIISLIGLGQFFTQFKWGADAVFDFWAAYPVPFLFGENFGSSVLEFPSWLVEINGRDIFRAISLFPDPHMLSFFLGLIFPFLVARQYSYQVIKILAILFYSFCLAVTFSRAGYVGLLFGLCLFAVWYFWKTVKQNGKKAILLFGVLAIVLGSIFSWENPVSSRFLSSFDFNDGSVSGRLKIWEEAADVWLDNFWLGTGLGNYSLQIKPTADYREPIYAHNTYLDIAAELGLVGLVLWLLIVGGGIIGGFSRGLMAPTTALVVFAAQGFFDTAIYSVSVLPLLLIVLALPGTKK